MPFLPVVRVWSRCFQVLRQGIEIKVRRDFKVARKLLNREAIVQLRKTCSIKNCSKDQMWCHIHL